MKKCILFIAALLLAVPLSAQHGEVETDIFGDLYYSSGHYSASLKRISSRA